MRSTAEVLARDLGTTSECRETFGNDVSLTSETCNGPFDPDNVDLTLAFAERSTTEVMASDSGLRGGKTSSES